MSVNISAAFARDDKHLNGLEAIEKDLIDDPLTDRWIIARVSTIRVTKDIVDGGTETPTVRLTHIEVMQSDAEEKKAKALHAAAYKARSNGATPPQDDLFSHTKDEA